MMAHDGTDDGGRGWVFDIQKFSLHDGAGIRTVVFLKGCPLACAWCSNPESQGYRPELLYSRDRCIGGHECDRCVPVCKAGAIRRDDAGKALVDHRLCDACGDCVAACPSRALDVAGRAMHVDEVVRIVEQDGGFYVRSGGGLTVSGGEPLAQYRFVERLLAAAHHRGIDTGIETSGLGTWEALRRVASHADQIFYDIKCMDPEKHRLMTGVSNAIILANFRRLRKAFPTTRVIVRTPVIPGLNDSRAEIGAIVDFIVGAGGAAAYELLAYHAFGEPKYARLGRKYPLGRMEPPSDASMAMLREVAASVDDVRLASC